MRRRRHTSKLVWRAGVCQIRMERASVDIVNWQGLLSKVEPELSTQDFGNLALLMATKKKWRRKRLAIVKKSWWNLMTSSALMIQIKLYVELLPSCMSLYLPPPLPQLLIRFPSQFDENKQLFFLFLPFYCSVSKFREQPIGKSSQEFNAFD